MWVTITLNLVTLVAMLAALASVANGTRKLDASLGLLLEEQRQRRRRRERELERVRQSVAAMVKG